MNPRLRSLPSIPKTLPFKRRTSRLRIRLRLLLETSPQRRLQIIPSSFMVWWGRHSCLPRMSVLRHPKLRLDEYIEPRQAKMPAPPKEIPGQPPLAASVPLAKKKKPAPWWRLLLFEKNQTPGVTERSSAGEAACPPPRQRKVPATQAPAPPRSRAPAASADSHCPGPSSRRSRHSHRLSPDRPGS